MTVVIANFNFIASSHGDRIDVMTKQFGHALCLFFINASSPPVKSAFLTTTPCRRFGP
jgi:hypothetical protein